MGVPPANNKTKHDKTMANLSKKSNPALPTLQELHHSPEIAFKNDQLKLLLNQQPPEKWVKVNKYANNSNYLPIDKVEFMLDRIFQQWRIEVIGYTQLFNAISCHVRVHYMSPIDGTWQFHDGVGASDVQVKAGSSPSELANINKNAVGMALPIAKSYAIKDACHHLGKLFGKDLNRADAIPFSGAYSSTITLSDLQTLYHLRKDDLSAEEIKAAERIMNEQEQRSYDKLYNLLMSKS